MKHFTDDTYNLPKKDWLINEFYPFYRSELERLGVAKWHKKFDCEDFASMFRTYAQVCHRFSGGKAQGIAIAEISYNRIMGGPHAINCAFTEEGPLFIEPQDGIIVNLAPYETSNIFFIKI